MNKHQLQRQLELDYDEKNIAVLVEPYKESLMSKPLEYLAKWKEQGFDFTNRPDLLEVVTAVYRLDMDKMIWQLLSNVLVRHEMTLQECMAMFFERIGEHVAMPYRRGHVFDVIVSAVRETGMIELVRGEKYNSLRCIISMGDKGQKRYGYVLPSIVRHKVRENSSAAYQGMHVITGGKHKQHDHNVCLDHIQRLSNIAYGVEERVLEMHNPEFDDEPKYKERLGRYETDDEVEERRVDFKRFMHELPAKIAVMLTHGNEFYFGHRYDTRLRTYLKAYHFDFIGNKHCRAFVQPKKGAKVTGVSKYL